MTKIINLFWNDDQADQNNMHTFDGELVKNFVTSQPQATEYFAFWVSSGETKNSNVFLCFIPSQY